MSDQKEVKDQSTAKENAESWKLAVETVGKISIACGILLTYWYLSSLNFHPRDLSLGDGLIFVFVLLGFSITIILGTFTAAGSIYWLFFLGNLYNEKRIKRWEKEQEEKKGQDKGKEPPPEGLLLKPWARSKVILVCSIFVTLIIACALIDAYLSRPQRFIYILNFFLAFYLPGFAIVAAFCSMRYSPLPNATPDIVLPPFKGIKGFSILAATFIFSVWAAGSNGMLIEIAMGKAGIFQENIPVELSPANYLRMKSVANVLNLPLIACELPETKNYLVLSLDVFWHGVGSVGLVGLKNRTGDSTSKVELDDAGIWPLHTTQRPTKCPDLQPH